MRCCLFAHYQKTKQKQNKIKQTMKDPEGKCFSSSHGDEDDYYHPEYKDQVREVSKSACIDIDILPLSHSGSSQNPSSSKKQTSHSANMNLHALEPPHHPRSSYVALVQASPVMVQPPLCPHAIDEGPEPVFSRSNRACDEESGLESPTQHRQKFWKKNAFYWFVGVSLAVAIAVVVSVVVVSISSSDEKATGAMGPLVTEPTLAPSPPVITPEPTLLPTFPTTDDPTTQTPTWSLHTNDMYEYHLWDTPVGNTGCVSFEVQANHDAHVGFFTAYQDFITLSPAEVTPGFYEIVIGGWNDTLSVVRDGGQGTNYDITQGSWLDGNAYKPFWACAKDNVVSMGEQDIAGMNVIACHFYSDVQREIQYVGFSTGFGSDGDWANIRIAENPELSC